MDKVIFKVPEDKDATSIGGLLKDSYQSLEKSLPKGKQAYLSEVKRDTAMLWQKMVRKWLGLQLGFTMVCPSMDLLRLIGLRLKKN